MISISKANTSDVPKILGLQKLAYRTEAEIYNNPAIQPLIQDEHSVLEEFRQGLILKAEEDGIIVGSVRAFVKNGTCFIGKLIVSPDLQNRGIGRQLMAAVEEAFPERIRFELFTGHRSVKNLAFYGKLGYRGFRQLPVNENLTLVFMEKMK